MKRIISIIFLLFITIPIVSGNNFKIQNYRLYMTHPEPELFIKQIRKDAAAEKGYTSILRNNFIRIIIPSNNKDNFLKKLKTSGYLNDEQVATSDVGYTIKQLETRLSVKKKYLSQIYQIFSGTNLVETLETEREINNTIRQIEQIEGQLRKYKALSATVRIDITVSSSAVSGTHKPTNSMFGWINSIGIKSLFK